jgi:type-F conjugative transfer system pilin assembly protein TrbC
MNKLMSLALLTTLALSHPSAAEEPVDASARKAADAIQQRVEAGAPAGNTATPKTDSPPRGLYVFISSSMPQPALLEIAKDAARLRMPIILRGLAGESLQDTLKTMLPLSTAGAALEIDPLLFETYKIERVPAVVRTCGARGEGPYAAVYGIGPSQALPILEKTLPCES